METIGNKLKAAREKMNFSRADVAKTIKINTRYVEAMEKDEFDKLIAPVYAKGFIKLYAQCVQIDPAPLLRQFIALEVSAQPDPTKRELTEKKKAVSKTMRWNMNVCFAPLLDALKKIKLQDISQIKIPALKPMGAPVKYLLMITVAVAICVIILSVFIKYEAPSNARLKAPRTCRWIADPPEPYLNMPAQKSTRSR